MERALDFTVAEHFKPLDEFIHELHEKDLKMVLIKGVLRSRGLLIP